MTLDYNLATTSLRMQRDLSARWAARTRYRCFADKPAETPSNYRADRGEGPPGRQTGGAGAAPRIGRHPSRGGHPAPFLACQAARPRAAGRARRRGALKAWAVSLAVALPILVLIWARARRAARWLDSRGTREEMSAGASPCEDDETCAFACLVRTASGLCQRGPAGAQPAHARLGGQA